MKLIDEINSGEFVACDFCNGGEETLGGILVGSYALCGDCAVDTIKNHIEKVSEIWNATKTFRENVLNYRERVYGTRDSITRFYVPEDED